MSTKQSESIGVSQLTSTGRISISTVYSAFLLPRTQLRARWTTEESEQGLLGVDPSEATLALAHGATKQSGFVLQLLSPARAVAKRKATPILTEQGSSKFQERGRCVQCDERCDHVISPVVRAK